MNPNLFTFLSENQEDHSAVMFYYGSNSRLPYVAVLNVQ